MTNRQAKIHRRVVNIGKMRRLSEIDIIDTIRDAEETKLYLEFDFTSIYQYTLEFLEPDEGLAYTFVNVARKAKKFPELHLAIKQQKITISKAARIAATLTSESAKGLVEFASSHSKREIEREVARINPKAAGKNRVKQLSDEFVEVTMTIPRKTFDKMKRAEDVHGTPLAETLERVYEEHLDRHDPVRKAKRNARKSVLCPGRNGDLNSAETHAVNARDEGQCTWIDTRGKRCPNERWTEVHHQIRRVDGGTNDLNNLTTLCGAHHRLIHARPRRIFENLTQNRIARFGQ
jgi:hypothetical protein